MRLYTDGDFPAATARLRKIADAQPGFTPARFYLGICLLLTGERTSGIRQLREAAASASSYRESAHFYLAKTYLGEGDIAAARQELNDLVAIHGELEKQAQVLLTQIQ